MKKIELEIPEGKEVKWVDNVLTLVDEQPKSIMDRVKSYEDACDVLSRSLIDEDKYPPHIVALIKLETIVKALNEGWIATECMNDGWWFPWFYRFDKRDKDKFKKYVRSYTYFYSDTQGGVAYTSVYHVASLSNANFGSRLALKSDQLAEYCGKQFIQLWCDYLLG